MLVMTARADAMPRAGASIAFITVAGIREWVAVEETRDPLGIAGENFNAWVENPQPVSPTSLTLPRGAQLGLTT